MPCVIALQGYKRPHISSDLERKEEVDERVDGVLGDVALDPDVVVALRIALERSSQLAHLGRRPPGSRDDLTDPTHGLSVGTEVRWKTQSASEDDEDPYNERDEPDHRCKRKARGQLSGKGKKSEYQEPPTDGTDVLEQVLGRNSLCSDSTVSERNVLWDRLVEVMADHEHLEPTSEESAQQSNEAAKGS